MAIHHLAGKTPMTQPQHPWRDQNVEYATDMIIKATRTLDGTYKERCLRRAVLALMIASHHGR